MNEKQVAFAEEIARYVAYRMEKDVHQAVANALSSGELYIKAYAEYDPEKRKLVAQKLREMSPTRALFKEHTRDASPKRRGGNADKTDGKKRRAKKQRDPKAPVGLRNNFIFFKTDPEEVKLQPETKNKLELAAYIKSRWKELCEAHKANPKGSKISKYNEQAQQDKLRHKEEMEQYEQGTFVKAPVVPKVKLEKVKAAAAVPTVPTEPKKKTAAPKAKKAAPVPVAPAADSSSSSGSWEDPDAI